MISNCPVCDQPVTHGMFTRRCECPACHTNLRIRSSFDEFSFDGFFWQIAYLVAVSAMLYLIAFFILGLWPGMAEKLAWTISLVLSGLLVHAALWRFHVRVEPAPK